MVSTFPKKDELMGSSRELREYNRADCAVFRKTAEAFGGLSNMAPGYPVRINGVRILTVEALYQACRFPHLPEVQRKIIDQTSPMTAKMVGKPYRGDSRPDWDRVRVKIMRWVLRVKLATHWSQFSALLLSTGDMPIVEDSRKDDFWGAMPTGASTLVGMNVLGRLLMELREEVKQGAELRRVEPPAIPDLLLYGEVINAVDFRQDKTMPYPVEQQPSRHADHDFSRSLFDEPIQEVSNVPTMGESRDSAEVQYRGLVADLKPYPAYKETGLPWLGSCPGHWALRRTKTLFRERVQKGFPNEPLLAATQTKGVVRKEDYGTRTVTAQKDLHLLKLVEPGDYVISLRSFQGGIEVAHCRGIISPAYTVLEPKSEAKSGYFTSFFKSRQFVDSLSLFVTGIREGQNIDYERMNRLEMPFPPAEEQNGIVKFLANAEEKFNCFIHAKQKMIKLLNEQKQSIIHRAVTRGLDKDVQFKESDFAWLGPFPEHWEIRRAKQVCSQIIDCKNRTPDQISGGEFTVVRTTNIRQGKFNIIGSYSTDRRSYEVWTERGAPKAGDIFFTREAPVGEACLVPDLKNLCMGQRMMYFRPNPAVLDAEFLLYSIYGPVVRTYIEHFTNGSTVGHLRLGQVRSLPLLLCPLPEQRDIVSRIKKESEPLSAAISRIEREIALMQEYRIRLISDIVTGKLNVREAAAILPALPADVAQKQTAGEMLEDGEFEVS